MTPGISDLNAGTPQQQAEVLPWHYVGQSGEPSFQNGWANAGTRTGAVTYTTLAYKLNGAGLCFLRGSLAVAAAIAAGAVIFTLPTTYRPERQVWLPAHLEGNEPGEVGPVFSGNNTPTLLLVDTNGNVSCLSAYASGQGLHTGIGARWKVA